MTAVTTAQRVVVRSHDSELGRWQIATRPPDVRLRQYIRQYEGYSEATSFSSRLQVPHPAIVLILNFGPRLEIVDPSGSVPPVRRGSFVAGLHDRPVTVTTPAGEQHGIQVNLTPLGAYQLFGLTMADIANQSVELEDLLGPSANPLIEQLRDSSDWDRSFDILETALIDRFADARTPSRGIAWAWSKLVETGGAMSVRDLAAGVGCSPRHLIEQFRDQIGLAPKTVARIVRFDRIARAVRDDDHPDWLELAHANGYYDQAHLIREFREFAGITPTAYLARRLPEGGGFTAD